jgi:hypothetical protein
VHTAPGGFGLMVGENELLPPGPTAFSVGATDAGASDVVGVIVGASFSLVLHALRAPMPTMAAPPARRAI